MENFFQVSFLPWFELVESITLGPVNFWPFPKMAEEMVKDRNIRTHLEKYFSSYVDHRGAPVKGLTVCHHGTPDFRSLSDIEYKVLRNAVDALVFSYISLGVKAAVCANNRSMGPPSADVFQLVSQNFQLGSDDIAVQAGSVTHVWIISEIIFPKPWSTGGVFGSFDDKLLKGFNGCFSPEFPADVRERLFRSLEWFRMAHIEAEDVSNLSRVVMMATAFEILLQFPRTAKRKHFVDYMEQYIASDKFNRIIRTDDKGRPHDLSMAGSWAWDVYEIRSRIVHGDWVPTSYLIYKDWLTHHIVADLVFRECMMRDLYMRGLIADNIRSYIKDLENIFPDKPLSKIDEENIIRRRLGFNDVHEALGWIPMRNSSPISC